MELTQIGNFKTYNLVLKHELSKKETRCAGINDENHREAHTRDGSLQDQGAHFG